MWKSQLRKFERRKSFLSYFCPLSVHRLSRPCYIALLFFAIRVEHNISRGFISNTLPTNKVEGMLEYQRKSHLVFKAICRTLWIPWLNLLLTNYLSSTHKPDAASRLYCCRRLNLSEGVGLRSTACSIGPPLCPYFLLGHLCVHTFLGPPLCPYFLGPPLCPYFLLGHLCTNTFLDNLCVHTFCWVMLRRWLHHR